MVSTVIVTLTEVAHLLRAGSALGLLLLNRKKDRRKARERLERAVETPAKDACDRLLHDRAVAKLASLDAK